MKKCIMAVAVGLSGLILAAGVYGADEAKKDGKGFKQGYGQGGRPGMMGNDVPLFALGKLLGDPKAVSDLGIPEDKMKSLKETVDQGQKQAEEFRPKIQDAEQVRKQLMDDNSMDENALIAAAEKISQLRLEMEKNSIRQSLAVKKILTPEQLTKLKEKARAMIMEYMKNSRFGKDGENKGNDKPEKPAGQ